jgi:hypothetical protein
VSVNKLTDTYSSIQIKETISIHFDPLTFRHKVTDNEMFVQKLKQYSFFKMKVLAKTRFPQSSHLKIPDISIHYIKSYSNLKK